MNGFEIGVNTFLQHRAAHLDENSSDGADGGNFKRDSRRHPVINNLLHSAAAGTTL
jgi:hypothetical protein